MIYSKPKVFAILFLIVFNFSSCKINQVKNNERHGKWIDYNSVENVNYKSVGRFNKGIEKGTHRQFANKKLHRKEKYKNGICKTTYYYPNGKIMSQGNTQLDLTEKEMHWYYQGDWKFYDEQGNLFGISTYDQGNLINQTEIKTK
ncbi:hypothetical protein ACFPVY_10720 [Flavobacterium qiangtangense]|uniref:MORN repeat protein n=1 Tax=Flavobacterium qiangtangense TaxID=1442595 RepID=A0ABW1PNA5_9FLAO